MSGTRVSYHDEQQPLADLLAFLKGPASSAAVETTQPKSRSESSNAPQDVGMHSKETKKAGKKEQGRSGRP
jgi:hypothetical protein